MDKSLNVLILEDNVSDAELVQYELRKAGFNFVARLTRDKASFLLALDTFHPDLLLVDYSLPGFDGITAATMARRRFENIPVILVSGAIGEETAIEALKAGATDYVFKQRLKRLGPVVRRALQEAEQQTERMRAEEALRKTAEELSKRTRELDAVLSFVQDYLYIFDPEGRFVFANERLLDLWGLTAEQAIGRTMRDLNYPEAVEATLLAGVRQVHQTGEVVSSETHYTSPTGVDGCYENILAPMRGRDGQVAFVAGSSRDITERRKNEEELRRSEERYRDLVERLPVALFEADRGFRLFFANRHSFGMFGFSCDDFAKGISGLELLAPEDRDRAKINFAMQLKGVEPGTVEYTALKKDGSTFPILLHAASIVKDGEIVGLQVIIVDITERKRAELEKARHEEQYQQVQKMESIGRLAGGVAHDLNNLLCPILSFSGQLLDNLDPEDVRREDVDQILFAGLRARDLVRQLLAFSRKQTLEYKPVDMNTAVIDFEKLLRRTIREDVRIRVVVSPGTCMIMADIGQIEQVIMNLAVNAQDAMPEGGCLTIETASVDLDQQYASSHSEVKPGAYVMLAISDTGAGIDDETGKLLFEPFFSTKGERGTGLGLATVHGIVKQHGGNISFYSELGVGTTFKVYLPVAESIRFEEKTVRKSIDSLHGSEIVLLVEDNVQVLNLAHAILKKFGYTVLAAENGTEALTKLAAHDGPVDLLLTDVVMPGMNGKELFARVAERFADLKVLYMSGYSSELIAHRGVLDEGIAFIQKPFTVQLLATRVREVLEQ